MPIHHVKSAAEFQKFINEKSHKAIIVKFTLSGCAACQHIKQTYEELSILHKNVNFLKVYVNELHEVSSKYGVRAMPTFQVFENGKKVKEIVGANKDNLINLIKHYD